MAFQKKPRILIIDDDEEYLEVVKKYLEKDCIPYIAQGGRAAIDFLRHQKADMILLDVEMPIFDGFHTLEAIRKLESVIDVPVVFVTGHQDRFTVMHSAKQGVDGYIVKPFEKEALLKKIEEVLDKNEDETEHKQDVLAVDDDMSFLKVLKLKLRRHYNVIGINSSKLALEYLSKHRPSLIILDYQMPMYSGASLLGMIRKNAVTKDIPVIMLSGTIDKDALMECYEHEPQRVLDKTIESEELIHIIKELIES